MSTPESTAPEPETTTTSSGSGSLPPPHTAPPPVVLEEDDDMALPKSFSGYTLGESPITFMEEFKLFSAMKGWDDDRKHAVFPFCLRGPAKAAYPTTAPADFEADEQ